VSIQLYRIDDRLIHGQVVVGWGQPLGLQFIVLVDDDVAASDWEQELYRMGVPPSMDVYFHSVSDVRDRLDGYVRDARPGMLLVGRVQTMQQLVAQNPEITRVNVGGVHHAEGRAQRLRYVFLTSDEEDVLRDLQQRGVEVTGQDVPSARPVPLDELLSSRQSA
jgi:PTS system mannose-specific IIB component/fructoselysine and glucoselysine-specific PTS system IIB component